MGWMWNSTGDCQSHRDANGAANDDSAFDGDVDIAIGLVYAALQWPEYTDAAIDWLVRMECEINTKYGDGCNYPTNGETWDKNCQRGQHATTPRAPQLRDPTDYYPPGYFRVFGDFLAEETGRRRDKAATGRPITTSGTRPPRRSTKWSSAATTRPECIPA